MLKILLKKVTEDSLRKDALTSKQNLDKSRTKNGVYYNKEGFNFVSEMMEKD